MCGRSCVCVKYMLDVYFESRVNSLSYVNCGIIYYLWINVLLSTDYNDLNTRTLQEPSSKNAWQSTKERFSSFNATGMAMLFSAGTFLYVATVHVLPEIVLQSHSHSRNGEPGSEPKGFRKTELIALIVGALLPLLLSVGHHH